jgi:DNA primase
MDESILNNYRYTSEYLIQRKFDLNTILFYEYGVNLQNNTITMPVRDHKGGLVFIKQRLLNPPPGIDKYLNTTGVPKQYLIYGFYHVLKLIESINNGTCSNKKLEENYKRFGLTVTEGEFNAAYLMQNGYPAISLLGRILFEDTTKRTVQQKELLLRYGIRQLVLWMDNDDPGREAQVKIKGQTHSNFILREPDFTLFPEINDANDHTPEQLDFIYSRLVS